MLIIPEKANISREYHMTLALLPAESWMNSGVLRLVVPVEAARVDQTG